MGLRVKEQGQSEGRAVTGRIEVEPTGDIISCASEQTSLRSLITREPDQPAQGAGQMAVSSETGAAPGNKAQWHQINWAEALRQVRRLQTRIVKATNQDRWDKVKALQHLLTHS